MNFTFTKVRTQQPELITSECYLDSMKIRLSVLRRLIREELEENALAGGAVTFGGNGYIDEGDDEEDSELYESLRMLNEVSGLNPDEIKVFRELIKTPEYKTIEAFVDFKMSDMETPDDMPEFTHIDVAALAHNLRMRVPDVINTLKDYGLVMRTRQPVKRVRGFTTSSHDRWYGPGSLATHGGAGIDNTTGRATVRGQTI